jgi:hypothetical protein
MSVRYIGAGPIAVGERPRAECRTEIVGHDVSRDVADRGALDKRDIVRTGRFLLPKRHIHIAEVEDERHPWFLSPL